MPQFPATNAAFKQFGWWTDWKYGKKENQQSSTMTATHWTPPAFGIWTATKLATWKTIRQPYNTTTNRTRRGRNCSTGLTSQNNARTMMVSPVNDGWGWWGCWGCWGWWHYIHITVDSFTFKSKLKKGSKRKIYKICLAKKYLHNRPTNNIHTYIYTNQLTHNVCECIHAWRVNYTYPCTGSPHGMQHMVIDFEEKERE